MNRHDLVSIHAPHEGERQYDPIVHRHRHCFNPRSPRGGATLASWKPAGFQYGFQSTLPTRGATRQSADDYALTRFNPRSHEGSDDDDELERAVVHVSIHAPHEGSDGCRCGPSRPPRSFNHAPHEERRSNAGHPRHAGQVQSTLPTRGSDRNYIVLFDCDIPISGRRSTIHRIDHPQSKRYSVVKVQCCCEPPREARSLHIRR